MFGGQRQAQIVLADINQVGEPFDKAQDDQDIGQRADGDAGVTLLKARDGARRRARTHRQIGHGDAAPQARAANVVTKPFEGGL
ncbi:hypothetical protein OO17_17500 [Rhodopseudomonas palustris]|uniref:Uncharacterized protein n=1 Tax=Rhodopseudomonas palustris TaxID=1076 RepID=A0A0D7EJ01_RHOPL|nr:hypothetical protein OO17_17500 [Rhodopseudomonas palustris]